MRRLACSARPPQLLLFVCRCSVFAASVRGYLRIAAGDRKRFFSQRSHFFDAPGNRLKIWGFGQVSQLFRNALGNLVSPRQAALGAKPAARTDSRRNHPGITPAADGPENRPCGSLQPQAGTRGRFLGTRRARSPRMMARYTQVSSRNPFTRITKCSAPSTAAT